MVRDWLGLGEASGRKENVVDWSCTVFVLRRIGVMFICLFIVSVNCYCLYFVFLFIRLFLFFPVKMESLISLSWESNLNITV